MLLNYPNNPTSATGKLTAEIDLSLALKTLTSEEKKLTKIIHVLPQTADEAFFSQAIAFCKAHGLLLIHDAPYVDLVRRLRGQIRIQDIFTYIMRKHVCVVCRGEC